MRHAKTFQTTAPATPPAPRASESTGTEATQSYRLAASALAVTATLAVGDTAMTLREACSHAGFYEANPLVTLLVQQTGSVAALLLFKAGLYIPALLCLYRQRRRRIARVGAWLVLLAHLWLAVVWTQYLLVMSAVPTAEPYTNPVMDRHPAHIQLAG